MMGGGAGDAGSGRGRGNPRERERARPNAPAARVPQPKVEVHETPPGSRRSGPALDPNMPDDLTKTRRIDQQLSEKPILIGITHYQQIADWTTTEVRSLSATLGLGRTVYQHYWIEQAARLTRQSAPSAAPAYACVADEENTEPFSFGEDHSTRTGNVRAADLELLEQDLPTEDCLQNEAGVTIMKRR